MNTSKKNYTNRGVSTLKLILLLCVVIAVLIFFNATSLDEIKQLFTTLGNGAVTVLKDLWYQIIMPIVNFMLAVLGRVVHLNK